MKITSRISKSNKANFALLAKQVQEKALRSTAYAGAKPVYEEVRMRAPVYTGTRKRNITPGQLRDAIYHAHSPERSSATKQVYIVSVNKAKAPHWHLIEYGHWTKGAGKFGPAKPRWVGPQSYLRVSFDAKAHASLSAMRDRFKQHLQQLTTALPKG